MGLFINKKEEEIVHKVPAKTQGIIASILLVVFGLFADLIRFIAEPFFRWVFDFRNGTETTNKVRGGLLAVAIVGGALLIYKIPAVRDSTLSAGTTVNLIKDGQSVPVPPLENFRERDTRNKLQFAEVSSVTYITFSRAFAEIAVLYKRQCQMITRGESMTISSREEPFFAIGFEDDVKYGVEEVFASAPWQERLAEYIFHYNRLRGSEGMLATKKIKYSKKASWQQLSQDWLSIRKEGIGLRSFTIQALGNENGMVCF